MFRKLPKLIKTNNLITALLHEKMTRNVRRFFFMNDQACANKLSQSKHRRWVKRLILSIQTRDLHRPGSPWAVCWAFFLKKLWTMGGACWLIGRAGPGQKNKKNSGLRSGSWAITSMGLPGQANFYKNIFLTISHLSS